MRPEGVLRQVQFRYTTNAVRFLTRREGHVEKSPLTRTSRGRGWIVVAFILLGVALACLATLVPAPKPAGAVSAYAGYFGTAYPPSTYGAIVGTVQAAANNCSLCHGGNPLVNGKSKYAWDFATAKAANGNQYVLAFHQIESKDSDGDGFTNIQEIGAGFLPSDLNNKPTATQTPTATPTRTNTPTPTNTTLATATNTPIPLPTGGTAIAFPTGAGPYQFTLNSKSGDVFVARRGDSRISRITASNVLTGSYVPICGNNAPCGNGTLWALAIDPGVYDWIWFTAPISNRIAATYGDAANWNPEPNGVNSGNSFPTTWLPYGTGVLSNTAYHHDYFVDASVDKLVEHSFGGLVTSYTVGSGALNMAVDNTRNKVYVTNYNGGAGNTVSVVNVVSNTVVSVTVGGGPYGLAVNEITNRIYVANSLSNTVSVIDGSNNVVIATISVGTRPHYVAVNPNLNRIYVTNYVSGSLSIIDGTINQVVATKTGLTNPEGVLANALNNRIYVADYGADRVALYQDSASSPTPTPTSSSTPTSIPTATSAPTNTPKPTSTLGPTPTATATGGPTPTATPIGVSSSSCYNASLSGANEVPPNSNTGTSSAVFVLMQTGAQYQLAYYLAYSNLSVSPVAIHIHEGAVGAQGPAIYYLPLGNNPLVGLFSISANDVNYLRQGLLYINIHTTDNDLLGGEIRGQILPCPPTTNAISPSNGAQINSADGRVSVTFIGGSVVTGTVVTYTQQTTPTQGLGNFKFAGTSFNLSAADLSGNAVTAFSQPFTITLHYTNADWMNAGIKSESQLNLTYWNGSAWVNVLPCAGCTLDTVNNVLTARLNHFTEFALLGAPVDLYLPIVQKP